MFASRITQDVEVSDGQSAVVVTIRKLSGNSLGKAKDARTADKLSSIRTASKDLLAFWKDASVEAVAEKLAERQKAEQDATSKAEARYAEYDRLTVLQAGIVRWSSDVKVTPDTVADLDEETADKLHRAILDLSLPALDPEADTAPKGGFAPSTGS
jgi:hypothetical protein